MTTVINAQLEDFDPPGEFGTPPSSRRLIATVYGLYAKARGGWLSVATLVRLLGDLGVDGPTVRTAVSRLKRHELLVSARSGGTAGYRLSTSASEALTEGDERIFSRRRARIEEGWLLVAYSVPEAERERRHQLRSVLSRLGLGSVSPGLRIAPACVESAVTTALERSGLREYTELFHSRRVGSSPLPDAVASWWDLDALQEKYQNFLAHYDPVRRRWDTDGGSPAQAFVDFVPMVTTWRRLQYLDPGLPLEVLPAEWTGVRAEEVFADLRARLMGPARDHAAAAFDGGETNEPGEVR
ncbi:PaaX family transcriptional regulator [Saccharopolyspora shandongensis]|uniref:PaaX family transcriptional regulator n=1 Tax=Saccharopolyspora shandongensis TaxID=418495 RepID=UPI0033D0A173